MTALTQSGLQHKSDMFLINAALPEPQAVIAKVGYSPEGLNGGRLLFQQYLDDKNKIQASLALQKSDHFDLAGYFPRHSNRTSTKPAASNSAIEPDPNPHPPQAKTSTTLAEDQQFSL
jgi:hypothetical protein